MSRVEFTAGNYDLTFTINRDTGKSVLYNKNTGKRKNLSQYQTSLLDYLLWHANEHIPGNSLKVSMVGGKSVSWSFVADHFARLRGKFQAVGCTGLRDIFYSHNKNGYGLKISNINRLMQPESEPGNEEPETQASLSDGKSALPDFGNASGENGTVDRGRVLDGASNIGGQLLDHLRAG